jgi:hypothetical protein
MKSSLSSMARQEACRHGAGHDVRAERVGGDGAGRDLECGDGDLGTEGRLLICEIVDEGAVHVSGDEDDIVDAALIDETKQIGPLGCVAFVAVLGVADRQVLDRLRQHDELPRDAPRLRIGKVVLQILQLDRSKQRPVGVEGLCQEPGDVGRVGRIDLRQGGVAERARIQYKGGCIRAMDVVLVELMLTVETRVRRGVVGLVPDRVVVQEGSEAVFVQRRIVDELGGGAGEADVGGGLRPAGKVVRHFMIVNGREDRGRALQVAPGVHAQRGAVDLGVLGPEFFNGHCLG